MADQQQTYIDIVYRTTSLYPSPQNTSDGEKYVKGLSAIKANVKWNLIDEQKTVNFNHFAQMFQ